MNELLKFAAEHWTYLTGWTITVVGLLSTAVWRYKLWDEKRIERARQAAKSKEKLALEIKELQKNNEALEDRVNRLSIMCADQIISNKKAFALAHRVNGRLDQIAKPRINIPR